MTVLLDVVGLLFYLRAPVADIEWLVDTLVLVSALVGCQVFCRSRCRRHRLLDLLKNFGKFERKKSCKT
jgi:hypothetical protein